MKLTIEDLQYLSLFENITGARTHDCIVNAELGRIIFVVKPGNIGAAIGRNGSNINQVRQMIGKEIEIVEFNPKMEVFLRNCMSPARIQKIKQNGTRNGEIVVSITVHPKDRGLAIGKSGRNIAKVRMLIQRYFPVQNIIIE